MLGGSGGMLPQQIRCSEIASEATFDPKRHYSYRYYLYVFACMTLCMYDSLHRRPHAMQWPLQWPLLKSPNFCVSSAEYKRGKVLYLLGVPIFTAGCPYLL